MDLVKEIYQFENIKTYTISSRRPPPTSLLLACIEDVSPQLLLQPP